MTPINVREFIKFLESCDPEAIVECVHDSCVEALDTDEHVIYIDFRNNRFVEDNDPNKNKRFLQIGK